MIAKVITFLIVFIILVIIFWKLWNRADSYEILARKKEMESNSKNAELVDSLSGLKEQDKINSKKVQDFLHK